MTRILIRIMICTITCIIMCIIISILNCNAQSLIQNTFVEVVDINCIFAMQCMLLDAPSSMHVRQVLLDCLSEGLLKANVNAE